MHFASLEVARWLSFGRVLFSPAQDEIFTLPERNVLVIDGLGNEDWSIYCAVTYEASRAMVYDLKEASYYKKPSSPQESERAPSNHRRVEIANFHERFPFQSSFFSVVVLRFPPAMSEAKLKNIVAECRRILAPGGHIEVMLLDFDFVNMGVQTRRAVRDLKMRMATKNPDVSLKPTIDNFQSLLGGRGFTGLNRCVVGVPVVGRAPGSTDSSSSSRSSSGLTAGRLSDPTRATRPSRRGQNFSLSDLVADPSESADAQIGRMVSKTARSWWQHCYEAAVIPNGDLSRSIFSEKKVVQECKMRASSFKLLIAFAQRPVFEARRRTMSEPATALTSTAGARRTKAP
jgi:SAM-dependent methyltransferase